MELLSNKLTIILWEDVAGPLDIPFLTLLKESDIWHSYLNIVMGLLFFFLFSFLCFVFCCIYIFFNISSQPAELYNSKFKKWNFFFWHEIELANLYQGTELPALQIVDD